jgi:uncharacterized membrane protein YheB (UPF0754 family)
MIYLDENKAIGKLVKEYLLSHAYISYKVTGNKSKTQKGKAIGRLVKEYLFSHAYNNHKVQGSRSKTQEK